MRKNFKVLLIYANSPMDNLMPISISSLAGALKRASCEVKLFDTTFYKWTEQAGGERHGSLQVVHLNYDDAGITFFTSGVFDDFRKGVIDFNPDLIGLSTVEPTHNFGIELLKYISDLNIPNIVGGVHTIFSPKEVINENVVDMICIGEGEKSLVELCDRMRKGEDYTKIDNIWVKREGRIYRNEKASLISMDTLPELDFSIFHPKRFYRPMAGKMYRMVPIEFSRGCIYKCSYCSAAGFAEIFKQQGKWFRHKPVSMIIEEIKGYISNYKVEYFYFVSETFLAMSKDRFMEFCKEYEKIKTPFWFNTRPETINSERIRILEDIGCHRMSVGVESGNEKYRKTMLNRNVTNATILKACEIVSNSSIQLSVNNIIGFPDETRDMIFDTINLNRKINAHSYSCSCSIFQPYRGTKLYKYCVDKGFIDPSKLAADLTVTSILKQPLIKPEEIQGIARTFPLYVKFPISEFEAIKKAEKFDPEGNEVFNSLARIYREKYEKK